MLFHLFPNCSFSYGDNFQNNSFVFYVCSSRDSTGDFIPSLYFIGVTLGIMHWTYISEVGEAVVKWTMITSCAAGPASFFIPARVISPFPRISAFDVQFTSLPEHISLGTEPITNKWNHQPKRNRNLKEEWSVWKMSLKQDAQLRVCVRNFSGEIQVRCKIKEVQHPSSHSSRFLYVTLPAVCVPSVQIVVNQKLLLLFLDRFYN